MKPQLHRVALIVVLALPFVGCGKNSTPELKPAQVEVTAQQRAVDMAKQYQERQGNQGGTAQQRAADMANQYQARQGNQNGVSH